MICDFTSSWGSGHYRDVVTVGRVRAKYDTTTEHVPVADLLATADRARLMRARAPWLSEVVETATTEMALPLISGGDRLRPERWDPEATNNLGEPGARVLDEHAVARMVAAAMEMS